MRDVRGVLLQAFASSMQKSVAPDCGPIGCPHGLPTGERWGRHETTGQHGGFQMQDGSPAENVQRWHAWRAACESGRDWAEAYDQYLHPSTRIDVEALSPELSSGHAHRHPAGSGAGAR